MIRAEPAVVVEEMRPIDWEPVRAVYAEGIETGDATFERLPPTWEYWDAQHLRTCRFVAFRAGEIAGWAALSTVSSRTAYLGVAEASIYVARDSRVNGVGKALGRALIEASEREGLWTLEGRVFPENAASLALCRSLGFRVVGMRERLGRSEHRWRDVVLVERRSPVIG